MPRIGSWEGFGPAGARPTAPLAPRAGRDRPLAACLTLALALALGACNSDPPAVDGDNLGRGGAGGGGGSHGLGGFATGGTDCAEEPSGTPARVGLEERPPNPTCHAPPRPHAALAVTLERVLPGVTFDLPLLLLQAPGDAHRFYVVEKAGRVLTFTSESDLAVYADISGRVAAQPREAGLLGMAFHPRFPAVDEVFLSYTSSSGGFHSVISRFHGTPTSLDEGSEEILLTVDQPQDWHNGGHIVFGPDGLLYIGMGDGGKGSDVKRHENLLGKLLRIDVDGALPYAIPPDNPWVDGPYRPEVWATGFRNPWRFSFDEETGEMWMGDVGASKREEVNRVVPGGHHGWNVVEGDVCHKDPCDPTGFVEPVYAYGRDVGQAITGGFVYRGEELPALRGAYVFGDFVFGAIWALLPGESEPTSLLESGMSLASFGQDNAGELYVVDHLGGGIYRLAREDEGAVGFPGKLSETGCFDPDDPRQPVEGMIPYDVNVPLWSDGTRKQRWMALPDGTKITVLPDGDWDFPPGTVLAKNFAFGCLLVETRLFVRHDDGGWAGYTYEWLPDQTDAVLLANEKAIEVAGRDWTFPSRAQCMQCHTAAAGRALGPETAQLDNEILWPTGRRADFIDTLVEIGLLEDQPDRSAGPLPAIDGDAHVEERAKSYLHANCSSCHRPGGTGQGVADFLYTTPLHQMGICDQPPQTDDLGVEDPRLLVPGDPDRSIVNLRMRTLAAPRMPPVGTAVVDETGTSVVEEWVRWLDACPTE